MTDVSMSARYIDTNVILRYLLDDDPVLSAQARVYIDDEVKNQTGVEVVAEAVYVLMGVYDVPRKEISAVLRRLFNAEGWLMDHKGAVIRGLELFGESSLDFVDAWLVALKRVEGTEILSFDRAVRRKTTT